MKKKVVLLTLMSFLIAGTMSASSVNGDFNGNPIVKLKSNGKELKVEDVPAVIYEGRTVVPIYLLKQLGVGVMWNGDDYSVDVTLPTTKQTNKDELDTIKVHGQIAHAAKMQSDLAEYILLLDRTLSLYFDGIYNNSPNAYTDQEISDRFDKAAIQYERASKTINEYKEKFLTLPESVQIDKNDENLVSAYGYYSEAAIALFNWNKYKITDPVKSEGYFYDHLDKREKASPIIDEILSSCAIMYNDHIQKVIN